MAWSICHGMPQLSADQPTDRGLSIEGAQSAISAESARRRQSVVLVSKGSTVDALRTFRAVVCGGPGRSPQSKVSRDQTGKVLFLFLVLRRLFFVFGLERRPDLGVSCFTLSSLCSLCSLWSLCSMVHLHLHQVSCASAISISYQSAISISYRL